MRGPDLAPEAPVADRPVSWTIAEDPSALVVRLARPGRAASSAVLGGGLRDLEDALDGARPLPHCGKHTSLGELLGRAALAAARRAILGAAEATR